MRIFVTGSDGFLGKAIAGAFAEGGHAVTGWGRAQGDLNAGALQDVFEREVPDIVVHAAGPAVVGASMREPLPDFHRSSCATAEVLEAVRRRCPAAGVIFLSSAAVYGNPASLPIGETTRLAALSPYGFHKRISETLLEEFRTVYGIRSVSVRIFSAYGEGLRRQVLWDICRKAATGPVVLQGDGSQSRDFIHREDVSSAILHLAENLAGWPEVVNLAFGREVTVADAAGWIAQELAIAVPVEYDGIVPAGNPQRWEADIRLLRSLGWQPRIEPEAGIRAFARWALRNLHAPT